MMKQLMWAILIATPVFLMQGCSGREKITDFAQLADKEFAVPTGTIADQLVLSRFPEATFQYYNSVLDAALAVHSGKADAVAYDEPTLRNIAAKNPGLIILPEMITVDHYGYAVRLDDVALKNTTDSIIHDIRTSGVYEEMMQRWLPAVGAPASMPAYVLDGTAGTLRFGTAAITEPFSFVDGSREVVGVDIEIASMVARALNKKLELVNMDFGAMIPALVSGKVDMIGACITITPERAKSVLFSEPYYTGGIAAMVKE